VVVRFLLLENHVQQILLALERVERDQDLTYEVHSLFCFLMLLSMLFVGSYYSANLFSDSIIITMLLVNFWICFDCGLENSLDDASGCYRTCLLLDLVQEAVFQGF
jgi:hypothetical protein